MGNSERSGDSRNRLRLNSRVAIFIAIGTVSLLAGTVILIWFPHIHSSMSFLLHIIGVLSAILAAIEASAAARQSGKTQQELIKIGLLATKGRENFQDIFADHLIAPLVKYGREGGEIYLLLSTPAYGYGVLGEGAKEFTKALTGLSQKCRLEMILFSPDAHFHYWLNVLLWSFKRKEGIQFALLFAEGLYRVLTYLMQPSVLSSCKIWLTKESTVRFFAYVKAGGKTPEDMFLSLTDQFAMAKDQYSEGFKARSMPIILTQYREFIKGNYNYFDRIKICPYSMRHGENACLDPEKPTDRGKIKGLRSDFMLGRTMQKQFADFDCFTQEFELFMLQSENEKSESNERSSSSQQLSNKTKKYIIEVVIRNIIEYFKLVCHDDGTIIATFSLGQKARIVYALRLMEKLGISNVGSVDGIPCDGDPAKEISNVEEEYDREFDELTSDITKRIYCLFILAGSGFGESQYGKAQIK